MLFLALSRELGSQQVHEKEQYTDSCKVGIAVPILWMRKLRCRGTKWFTSHIEARIWSVKI